MLVVSCTAVDASTGDSKNLSAPKLDVSSIKVLEHAVKLNPRDKFAYSNLGYIYRGLKQYPKSIELLNKAIDLDHKFGVAFFNRAIDYSLLGHRKKAKDDFVSALKSDPTFFIDSNSQKDQFLVFDFHRAAEVLERRCHNGSLPAYVLALTSPGATLSNSSDSFKMFCTEFTKQLVNSTYFSYGTGMQSLMFCGVDSKLAPTVQVSLANSGVLPQNETVLRTLQKAFKETKTLSYCIVDRVVVDDSLSNSDYRITLVDIFGRVAKYSSEGLIGPAPFHFKFSVRRRSFGLPIPVVTGFLDQSPVPVILSADINDSRGPSSETPVAVISSLKEIDESRTKWMDFLAETIRLHPEDADAYLVRGSTYRNSGQYQQAYDDLSKAIEGFTKVGLDDRLAAAYNERGLVLKSIGQHQHAIDDFSKAIHLSEGDPYQSNYYLDRAILFKKLRQFDKAIPDYCNFACRDADMRSRIAAIFAASICALFFLVWLVKKLQSKIKAAQALKKGGASTAPTQE